MGQLAGSVNRVGGGAKTDPASPQPCQCGCGVMTASGKRFVSGHNSQGRGQSAETRQKLSDARKGALNPMFGKKSPSWRGGRYPDKSGYIMRTIKNHPFAPFDKIREHRLFLERHLRKTDPGSHYLTEVNGTLYLRPEIIVHHIDGVKDNNKITNLQPMTPSEHRAWHNGHRHPHK